MNGIGIHFNTIVLQGMNGFNKLEMILGEIYNVCVCVWMFPNINWPILLLNIPIKYYNSRLICDRNTKLRTSNGLFAAPQQSVSLKNRDHFLIVTRTLFLILVDVIRRQGARFVTRCMDSCVPLFSNLVPCVRLTCLLHSRHNSS